MPYKNKEKQKEYQRNWMTNRRKKFLDIFGNECCKCARSESLEFDHINPETKITHRIWSWSEERIRTELDKCQLLCRPCHQKKTFQENYA